MTSASNQDETWRWVFLVFPYSPPFLFLKSSVNMDSISGIKNVEGDDGLRTLECLRGRLLAERQATKSAKEDAELIGKKLRMLENKLQEEAKLREKAEKKFKFLLKKLESLKISHNLDRLFEQWNSSSTHQKCEISCTSSTSSSGSKKSNTLEDSDEPKSQITISLVSSVENQSCTFTSQEISRVQDSSGLKDLPLSKSSYGFTPSCQDSNTDDEGEVVDTSASVTVNLPVESTKRCDFKIINERVDEVLDSLRLARGDIQSS